ncbi:MAG TPA: DUF58 domain-containing protein [Candidatus Sulfotelmatobacter sp.]|nr:DUF58 domain-containing protein [Candidatus Sulfotelmatobacter sp.]
MASPSAGAAQSSRQRAEQLASVLPPLLVEAERVASTIVQGVHGRRRVGQGEAFWQFRRYQPGDPAGRIDWRMSARSQSVFVRENEWEAAQSVWLWRDGSASMRYRSGRELPEKRQRAELLLLAAASLLLRGGERIALLGAAAAPASSRATLSRIAAELDSGAQFQRDTGVPPTVPLPRYSRLVLIGDFLAPPEALHAVVSHYAAHGVEGHILLLLDPAELTLPFAGRVRFEGLEDEGSLIVRRTETLRAAYLERIEQHRAALADIARAVGWSFGQHATDHPPEAALLALYAALSGPDRR